MNLTKKQRETIRVLFGGKCAYCGVDLTGRWHADHVDPVERQFKFVRDKRDRLRMVATGKLYRPQNDRLENLYPACAPCNIDKHCSLLEAWRKRLEDLAENCRRNVSAFRHAERFGRVTIVGGPVVFWFEKYRSNLCDAEPPAGPLIKPGRDGQFGTRE